MTAAAWILTILTAVILCLLVSLLFYRPDRKRILREDFLETAEKPEIQEQPSDHDLMRIIALKWPDLSVVFDRKDFSGGVLLRWKGLCRSEDSILFDVTENGMMTAVLECASEINEENSIPENRFMVYIHTADDSRRDLTAYLRTLSILPDIVITEGCGISDRMISGRKYACISVGRTAVMRLQIIGDTARKQTFLKRTGACEKRIDGQSLAEIIRSLRPILPAGLRIQSRMPFLKRRTAENLISLAPELAVSMQASVTADDDMITVTAPSDAVCEETLSDLRETADAAGVSLHMVQSEQSDGIRTGGRWWNLMSETITALFGAEAVIPVLKPEHRVMKGISSIGFSPVVNDDRHLNDAMISFYANMIMKSGN